MAYDATKPADTQFISAGPADIRANQEALRTERIVDALKVNGYSPGNASGNIPVSNGTVCTNLNADMLEGNHASAFATSGHTHNTATTSSSGFMSNTDKSKLDSIATGAEVNQNTFPSIVVDATTIQADAKSDTFTMVSGANITLTPDATNDKVTVSVSGIIPVANGGTGASTAVGALTNLGLTATATEINYIAGVTGNVQTQLNGKAATAHASTATTFGVASSTNYGHAKASSATPLVAGAVAVGTDNGEFARADHVHPAQTTITGNAASATKLQTARTIALTGAVTGTVSTDLSGNVSIATSAGTSSGGYDASHSFAVNGYQKFANGLIIQWGQVTIAAESASVNVTFPISFVSACYSVVATPVASGGSAAHITSITKTKCVIGRGVASGANLLATTIYWIAIGV